MKSIRIFILFLLISFISAKAFGQLWKQYADSAYSFYDQRKMEKARVYGDTAIALLKVDSFWTNTYARACNDLANLYRYLEKHKIAESMFLEVLQIREKIIGKEHPDYAITCANLGFLYNIMGQFKKAEIFCIEAKDIMERTLGKKSVLYGWTCSTLAILYMDMGQYKKSEPLYLKDREIIKAEEGTDNTDYASNCFNMANLYADMGMYEKAEPLSLEAKKLRRRILGSEDPDYASSCDNLANIYTDMGLYEKAELLYLEAKQIWKQVFGEDHSDYARICTNLGSFYWNIGQYKKAEPLFLEAMKITDLAVGKGHPVYIASCINLANVYLSLKQSRKAEPFFLQAKSIEEHKTEKDDLTYALCCNSLAELYWNEDQYIKAEPLYTEALRIREQTLGKDHSAYTESCMNLGNLYWNLNKPGKASDYYTNAFQSQDLQVRKIFQFTSEVEQQSYLKKIADRGKIFLSFNSIAYPHLRQGVTYDHSLRGRNTILSSSQQLRNTIYNSNDTVIKNKYNNWINLREQISFWHAKPIADRPEYVKGLEDEANTLEKELMLVSTAFKKEQSGDEINWKKIQQSLRANEAAIEFIEFNYYTGKRWSDSTYYVALVLRKDRPEPVLVRLFEKKQLDKLLSNTENSATDTRINKLYAGGSSLYTLTWKPLEKYLAGISKVYFASAGNLFKISFAAMPVNDKQVLGDKYQLVQLNTTVSVVDNDQSNITAADKIQLYGGIRYDADSAALKQAVASYQLNSENARSLPSDLERGAGFQYLPGTQKETEAIKKEIDNPSIPVSILSGTDATEESVKALTGKNSPSVLHIATHGFFFPDPKDDKRDSIQRKFETSGKAFKQSDNPLFRSGLLFAGANNAWQGKPIDGIEDGILTAYEVSNLYLPNTKLVVLSACETALGDIQGSEGVYGLQRAFKMAGVQNLVMSLWKVPDAETAEFMQLFYKNLFAKQTISNAFYNAQKLMKNKYRDEPYKWAAWVLVR